MGKRLIDADKLNSVLIERQYSEQTMGILHTPYPHMMAIVAKQPTVDAVEIEKYNELKHDNDVLKRLINGEWVDTEDVQRALGIDFSTGMGMFEFCRTARWNPAPLNGQYIETKFRLKGRSDE